MDKLVLATRNAHKVDELKEMLKGESIEVLSLTDYPEMPDVVEDGTTFEANALKKAREVCQYTGLPALADDSGLEVNQLDGAPGVYSARFSGPNATSEANNEKLLKLLESYEKIEERRARFKSVIALVLPNGVEKVVEGTAEGFIVNEYRGRQGFGYDPLFYVPAHGKTFAELPMEVKNQISHRGKAFRLIIEEIRKL